MTANALSTIQTTDECLVERGLEMTRYLPVIAARIARSEDDICWDRLRGCVDIALVSFG